MDNDYKPFSTFLHVFDCKFKTIIIARSNNPSITSSTMKLFSLIKSTLKVTWRSLFSRDAFVLFSKMKITSRWTSHFLSYDGYDMLWDIYFFL